MTSTDIGALVKKYPIVSICGLICAILGILLYFRSSEIDEKQATYEKTAAEANKIISNVSISKNLPEQVEEIRSLAKDLESRLVSAGQLAVNLQYFYKLEAETKIKLLDVRQSSLPKKSATVYSGVPYNVTIQGPFKQVMLFMNRLENGRHFCRFGNVTFNKVSGTTDGSNPMTVTLSLELLGQP